MKLHLSPLFILPIFFLSCDSQNGTEQSETAKIKPQKEIITEENTQPIQKTEEYLDSSETKSQIEVVEEIHQKELAEITENTEIKKTDETEETQQVDSVETPKEKIIAEPHQLWDVLTRKHINADGKVNYAGFLSDKKQLEQYLNQLKEMHSELTSWNKRKQLAYWINMYNTVTVKLIIDNYPVSSITELKGGKPWDTPLIELSGTSYTLNVIENKIIRPKFKDPRIHFAVNCAAKSCPKIMNKAWTEHNLERALTAQTKEFLANKEQNTLQENDIIISKIFDWYKADFGSSNQGIIEFINTYSNKEIDLNATVSFNEYDWSLNSK